MENHLKSFFEIEFDRIKGLKKKTEQAEALLKLCSDMLLKNQSLNKEKDELISKHNQEIELLKKEIKELRAELDYAWKNN